MDIPVVQKGGNNADDFRSNVLNFDEFQLGYVSHEKASLLDVYYSFVGHNPSVEVVVEPEDKKEIPDKKSGEALSEKQEFVILAFFEVCIQRVDEKINGDKARDCHQNKKQAHEKNEPVAA